MLRCTGTLAITLVANLATIGVAGTAGCDDRERDEQQVVVRVAAPFGFEGLVPEVEIAGSEAHAIDLVYEPIDRYATVVEHGEKSLILERRPDASLRIDQLARAIRLRERIRVSVQGEDLIRVECANQHVCEKLASLPIVDDGPFEIVHDGIPLRLRPRHRDTEVDVLEIYPVTTEDQWRLLHGRRIDVLPLAEERFRDELETMPGVRVVDLHTNVAFALLFNQRSRLLQDLEARAGIRDALDRAALSEVVCRSASCRIPDHEWERAPIMGRRLPADSRLLLAADPTYEDVVLAAEVVRHQLRALDIDVELRWVSYASFLDVFESGEIHLAIAPWVKRSPNSYALISSFTGYSSEEYRDTVELGDLERAQSLLLRDSVLTPLFVPRFFAVIDNRLCGDVEPELTSWLWIAGLRPCEPGEVP